MEDLGKVAYEAYGASVGWMTVNGQEMPRWDDQRLTLRAAWQAAAQAVAARLVPGEEDADEEGGLTAEEDAVEASVEEAG